VGSGQRPGSAPNAVSSNVFIERRRYQYVAEGQHENPVPAGTATESVVKATLVNSSWSRC
jgi:hypothetical protein